MAKLIYSMITSLDGYVADENDSFDWAEPDEEVHTFVNDLQRPIGTYLYGRRMYETMVFWETALTDAQEPAYLRDYADIWRAADKVVFSSGLPATSSARTRIERNFDLDRVRQLRDSADRDICISGPHLAAQAIRAGLVHEFQFFVVPIVVGAGNPSLPDGVVVPLELVEERRFGGGMVYLHYRAATPA